MGSNSSQPDAAAVFGGGFASLRIAQGRGGELVGLIEQIVADNPGLAGFSTALAQVYCELGRLEDAWATLERMSPMDSRR